MSRRRYFAVRILQTIVMLWLVLTFLFFFFRLMPGSIESLMLRQGVRPEQLAAFKARWGLDQPLYVQYYDYMSNFVTGDAGRSLSARMPVLEYVRMRIFNSFILIAPGITLGFLFGSGIGTLLGTNRGTKAERAGVMTTITIGTVPIFFFAIVMIIVFSGWLNLVPSTGMLTQIEAGRFQGASWWRPYLTLDFAWHYILPFTVIALRYINLPALIMRTSVVEVLGQDFMNFHRMTGLPRRKRLQHVAKHSSLPVITMYPVAMTRAVGGLVLLEVVFNWPGIGYTLVQAVLERDFPVVQFIFFLVAAFVLFGNLFIDILYGIIDPRVAIDGD